MVQKLRVSNRYRFTVVLLAAALGWLILCSTGFAGEAEWTFLRDGNTPGEPPARVGAVIWKTSDGCTYLFGGNDSNDLWKFDPLTNRWSLARARQQVSYGTQGVPEATNAPSARDGAVSWTGVDGSLYLFGGHGYATYGGSLNDLWRYDVLTNTWTWLKGSSSADQYGVYGTQGVGAPENTPGSSWGAVSWTGSDGSLYLFGGWGCGASDCGYLNDLWRYDVPSSTWTWLKGSSTTGRNGIYGTRGVGAPENTPGSRSMAVSWTGSDRSLYLFGGWGYNTSNHGYFNDLWRYDILTNTWTWLKGSRSPNEAGVYGIQGAGAPVNTPGARDKAVSWTGSDGSLYLFGGEGTSYCSYLNDLWRYDVLTNTWTWLKGSSSTNEASVYGTRGVGAPENTPGSRWRAVSWTGLDGSLYLFGGEGYVGYGASSYNLLNDLWRYDALTNTWTCLRNGSRPASRCGVYGTQGVGAPENTPGERESAVSWTGRDGSLYLFGGEGYCASYSDGWLNDLWSYDVLTNDWTWLKGSRSTYERGVYGMPGVGAPENTPGARTEAVSWTGHDGSFYLFGGAGYAASDSGYLNDLWRYDVSSNTWTWLKGSSSTNEGGVYGTQGVGAPENTPGARHSAVSWTGSDGSLYLFGGKGFATYGDCLNDLWRYDVLTNTWTWLKGSSSANQCGVYGTQGVGAPENTPGSRWGAVSWTGSDGSLYLFGGGGDDELWRYDVPSNTWTWLKGLWTTGQHGVYGTQGVGAPENTPGSRSGAVSWTTTDGSLYLFGGGDYNDLWRYDVLTNTWTWLKGSGSMYQLGVNGTQGMGAPENTPGSRSEAVSWTTPDGSLYFFGGDGLGASYSSDINDLWGFALPCADVSISGCTDASTNPLTLGQNLTYQITVSNSGRDATSYTRMNMELPAGARFVSAAASQGRASLVNGVVEADLGGMAVGGSTSVTVVVLPTRPGTQLARTSVSSNANDPDISNNFAAVFSEVVVGSGPDLNVSWSGVSAKARKSSAGTTWRFKGTCTAANTGDADARSNTLRVFVSDTPSVQQGAKPGTSTKLSTLKPGRASRKLVTVDLPAGAVASGKYVIAVVDAANDIAESNEFNNVSVCGPLP